MGASGYSIPAVILILLLALLLFFRQGRRKSYKYGPPGPVGGVPSATGRLLCQALKAPILGKTPRVLYLMELSRKGAEITGRFYPEEEAKRNKRYSGAVFLDYRQDRVYGRIVDSRNIKVVSGRLTPVSVDVTLGFPKESVLGFLRSAFQFGIQSGGVRFLLTDKNQGDIHREESRLAVKPDRISGKLVHYRESWLVDVEVAVAGVAPEAATLAVMLMVNDILRYHHAG